MRVPDFIGALGPNPGPNRCAVLLAEIPSERVRFRLGSIKELGGPVSCQKPEPGTQFDGTQNLELEVNPIWLCPDLPWAQLYPAFEENYQGSALDSFLDLIVGTVFPRRILGFTTSNFDLPAPWARKWLTAFLGPIPEQITNERSLLLLRYLPILSHVAGTKLGIEKILAELLKVQVIVKPHYPKVREPASEFTLLGQSNDILGERFCLGSQACESFTTIRIQLEATHRSLVAGGWFVPGFEQDPEPSETLAWVSRLILPFWVSVIWMTRVNRQPQRWILGSVSLGGGSVLIGATEEGGRYV